MSVFEDINKRSAKETRSLTVAFLPVAFLIMCDEWDDNLFPLAYLLTFRTYGSWLHGDARGSVDVHGKNIYGTPDIAPNKILERTMRANMQHESVLLNEEQRAAVEEAIKEICAQRGYFLQAVNARSNHVHAVVSAQVEPKKIIQSLKAYATRKLHHKRLIEANTSVWARGQSRRYLWKPRHVALAIEYVLYSQGDVPFMAETRT